MHIKSSERGKGYKVCKRQSELLLLLEEEEEVLEQQQLLYQMLLLLYMARHSCPPCLGVTLSRNHLIFKR
jgi:hypothetical protein